MEAMSIAELHELRLAVLSNAVDLAEEAQLLLGHRRWARSFLLAHYSIEELGKIPMIVGVIGRLMSGATIDWREARRRLVDHKEKLRAENMHFYTFGLEIDLVHDTDLAWLKAANEKIEDSYQLKNTATYVDARGAAFSTPVRAISQEMAERLMALAQQCVQSHLLSERLTNPAFSG